jgi:hypothetical protein
MCVACFVSNTVTPIPLIEFIQEIVWYMCHACTKKTSEKDHRLFNNEITK